MQLWQYCLLVTARSLYMFRTLSASIITSTITEVAATGACHGAGWHCSSKDVQGRLPTTLCAVRSGKWSFMYNVDASLSSGGYVQACTNWAPPTQNTQHLH